MKMTAQLIRTLEYSEDSCQREMTSITACTKKKKKSRRLLFLKKKRKRPLKAKNEMQFLKDAMDAIMEWGGGTGRKKR